MMFSRSLAHDVGLHAGGVRAAFNIVARNDAAFYHVDRAQYDRSNGNALPDQVVFSQVEIRYGVREEVRPPAPRVENIEATDGAVLGKIGAEGLYGVAIPSARLGIAIKVLDGNSRALDPIVVALLRRFAALPTFLKSAWRSWPFASYATLPARLSESCALYRCRRKSGSIGTAVDTPACPK